MYLREMGSVELLSREGEIAIAKRIEAGREMMIGGLCESPLTIRALVGWRDALIEGRMLLRDIVDLDATYGNNAFDASAEAKGEAELDAEDEGDSASNGNVTATARSGRTRPPSRSMARIPTARTPRSLSPRWSSS